MYIIAIYSFLHDDNGSELWVTDGTEAGTYMVKDINSDGNSYPNDFVNAGDKMYFTATGPFGRELYTSDGSTNGTQMVNEFNYRTTDSFNEYNYYDSLFVFDSYLLFQLRWLFWRNCILTDKRNKYLLQLKSRY